MSGKMHKVAIIKTVGGYENYDDYNGNLFQTISEWEEIDHDTFITLQKAGQSLYGSIGDEEDTRYHVVEQLPLSDTRIINSVAAYVKRVAEKKAAAERAAAKRAVSAEEKRLKALTKDEAKKKKLYLQLKAEFEANK